MRRARAVVVLALAILAGAATPARAEPPCIPGAAVTGDPNLVATVTRALYERGLSISEAGRCGTVRAEVAPEDQRVRVRITDADGRTVERVADDGEGAATAIEAWARQDVADPLLAARSTEPEPSRRAPAEATAARSVAPPRRPAGWDLGALGVAALSDDGAFWSGLRAQLGVRVGWAILGGRVGLGLDTGATGTSSAACAHTGEDYTTAAHGCETSRTALDVVLTASVPLTIGGLEIAPGLGVGERALWSSRAGEWDADERSDDSTELLLQAQVAASVRLAREWAIRMELTGAASPTADTRLGARDPRSDLEFVPSLAGAPVAQGLVGIGLAWEPEAR